MKTYKYFINVVDQNGNTIFSHQSDNAASLIKKYNRESCDSEGNMYCHFWNAKMETNIPDDMWVR